MPNEPLTSPVEVVVADGRSLVRAGLAALLDAEPDVTVVAQAATAEQALALSRRLGPDVLLLNAELPPLGGVDAMERIAADPQLGRLNVVMVTGTDAADPLFAALRAGVRAFLVDADLTDLAAAVRAVACGDAMLSPSAARRLIEAVAVTRPTPGPLLASPSPAAARCNA